MKREAEKMMKNERKAGVKPVGIGSVLYEPDI